MLRTRSPVYSPLRAFSLDLHVLGTPPAFVLSQDQTLQLSIGVSFLAHLFHAPPKRSMIGALKALRVPQSFFVDLLSSFQRPTRHALPTPHFRRPRPPAVSNTPARGALPTAASAARQESCCRSFRCPPNRRGPPDLPGPRCRATRAAAVNFGWDIRCDPTRGS